MEPKNEDRSQRRVTIPSMTTDARRETFRMVPDRLWADLRLEGSDVRLWCVLSFLARGKDAIDATDASLADLVGLSERAIRDCLGRLQDCGFIKRHGRGRNRTLTLHPEGDGEHVPALGLRVVG